MKREQLLSAIRKWCRKNNVAFRASAIGGKGSHMRVYVGSDRVTMVKSGDLSPVGLVPKQLGIPGEAIRR
jgi:hypothetical protein